MTPLEKKLQAAQKAQINYCDECESFTIVGSAAYCKVDGKLLHPLMYTRGQGSGPASRCEKRRKGEEWK